MTELTDHEVYSAKAKACGIPSYMIPGLVRYLISRIPPGSFLAAVLENDFMRVLEHADTTNVNCLKAYGVFLYNHAPLGSYGSSENVEAWLKGKK